MAIDASADAGYPEEWYLRSGTQWIVRRSTFELSRPIVSGERLEVSTWVADFRRVRSRRESRVRSAESGEIVGSAHTDWVYLDVRTGRLARIPDAMLADFVPADAATSAARRPLVLARPAGAVRRRVRRVEFRELDPLGHVNNANYLDHVDEDVFELLAEAGWPPDRMLASGAHVSQFAYDVEYLEEARYRDDIECSGWTAGADPTAFERCLEIVRARDGLPIARMWGRWRWIAGAAEPPGAMPDQVLAALTAA